MKYLAYHTAEVSVNGFSGCYFKKTADITLSSGASWLPIGYFWSSDDADAEPFRGNFDGNGHRIRNLNISNSGQTYAGLFGQTMGANIQNVSVSASISASNLCAGIVGEANDTVVRGCLVSETVKAAGTAGGIVGEAYESVIDDCKNTATVYASKPAGSAEPVFAGGIVGSAHDSKMVNCSNESTESATSMDIITISQEGMVSVNKDAKWITDLVSAAVTNQLTLYPAKPIALEATAYASATVTAQANSSRASSLVAVEFKVTDHTVVPVESVSLNESSIGFDVERVLTGDRLHPEEIIRVTPGKRLYATVAPVYSSNRQVDFTKGDGMNDQDMVTLDAEGLVNVNPNARWIADLISAEDSNKKEDPYIVSQAGGNRATYVTAVTADGGKTAVCAVNVNFKTTDKTVVYAEGISLDRTELEFTIQATKEGPRTNPQVTYQVTGPQTLQARVLPAAAFNQKVLWRSGDTDLVVADSEGNISVRSEGDWIKELVSKSQATADREIPVVVQSEDGGFTDTCMVRIHFVLDRTYAGGSGGSGGGSGGGGGGSSSGSKPGGTTGAGADPGNAGAMTGTWQFMEENRSWSFQYQDGLYARDRWEQIFYNGVPEWYFFDRDGAMKTGWYTDSAGHTFYLYPVPDGNRGRMVTGWNLIDGKWYYFITVSDGTKGCLLKNTVTPDNYRVDQDGVWTP